MMISRLFKVVAISITVLFIQACSHPIEIVGQGDVTSASGNRNCYLEDFQTAKTNCTKNYAVGAYQETYYATPRAGWKFDHWVTYCQTATPPNYDCTFNTPAAVVSQYWGQTMPPLKAVFTSCTPGAPGCGWKAGDMTTGTQTLWGDSSTTIGGLLNTNFNAKYPTDFVVGLTNTLRFSDSGAVFLYLPATGPAGVLGSTVLDPQTTAAGELGGEVTALVLNTDFSSLLGNSVPLASLRICNFASLPALNGQTVAQFTAVANHILGGGSASISPTAAAAVARLINNAFGAGTPSTFAQASLVAGNCTN